MHRILLIGTASAALLGACSQTDDAGEQAESAVNATQDAVGAAVGQTSAATLGANTVGGFVSSLAISDMYELAGAELANTKGQSDGVKELARMIRTDHTASSERLKTLAATEAQGETLPTEMDERRQGLIDNLEAAAPADFDRVYLTQQVAAHNEALTLLNGFADNTEAPQLAAFARELTPKITMHRDRAQQLLDAM
jgi:putative membrane protein